VFWGGLHGLYLCVNHANRWAMDRLGWRTPRWLGWGATFAGVTFAWVFFRAQSFERAFEICRGMLGLNGVVIPSRHVPGWLRDALEPIGVLFEEPEVWTLAGPYQRNLILLGLAVCLLAPTSLAWTVRSVGRRPSRLSAVIVGVTLLASLVFMGRVSEFLYFQF
jgi:alginate O-acetyltransferase complex protein AlgI